MIIEHVENIEEKVRETASALNEEKLLKFLDYFVLMLSQANTVEDIDLIMDDFLSEDVIHIIQENSELFNILSIIWIDTFDRICMKPGESNFSLKVLWLPILYKRFNWSLNDVDVFNTLHSKAESDVENSDSLCPYLNLLFVEGFTKSTEKALTNFKEKTEVLIQDKSEKENIESIISDVKSIGW